MKKSRIMWLIIPTFVFFVLFLISFLIFDLQHMKVENWRIDDWHFGYKGHGISISDEGVRIGNWLRVNDHGVRIGNWLRIDDPDERDWENDGGTDDRTANGTDDDRYEQNQELRERKLSRSLTKRLDQVTDIRTFEEQAIDKIVLDIENGDLIVSNDDDTRRGVYVYEPHDVSVEQTIEGRTLIIRRSRETGTSRKTGLMPEDAPCIGIFLSEKYAPRIEIKLQNGNLLLDETNNELKVNAKNGDVIWQMENSHSADLTIENGDLIAELPDRLNATLQTQGSLTLMDGRSVETSKQTFERTFGRGGDTISINLSNGEILVLLDD